MRHIILPMILAAAFATTGCSSMTKAFANRVACTADGSRAVVASMYGPIGVVGYVEPGDAAAICAPRRAP